MVHRALRLKFILDNLNEISLFKRNHTVYKGIMLNWGVCDNAKFDFYDKKIKFSFLEKFGNINELSTNSIYPIGGWDEYKSNPNLYSNPRRKDFILFCHKYILDNMTWFQKFHYKMYLKFIYPKITNIDEIRG